MVNMATLTDQKKVGKCIQDIGLLYVMLHRLCNGGTQRVNHAKKTIHHVAMHGQYYSCILNNFQRPWAGLILKDT